MLDLHFRATSKRALVKLGKTLDFIDDDNNPLPGVNIDIIPKGAMVHKPAIYDENGVETTPAVVDNTHIHVNVRLNAGAALLDKLPWIDEDGFDKSRIRRWCRDNGVSVDVVSIRQDGAVTHKWFKKDLADGDVIELIWPAPEFQRRVWL